MGQTNPYTKIRWDRTPVKDLKVGPFSGGMNKYSDPSAIADSELVECLNFDIDLDGSLKSRPPWHTLFATFTFDYSATLLGNNTNVLGSFVVGGYRVVVGTTYFNSSDNPTRYGAFLYWVDGPNAGTYTYIDVQSSNPYTSVLRYNDILYFTRGSGGGYKWNTLTQAGTSLPSMPGGSACIIYKERMWIIGDKSSPSKAARMYFSDVGNPESYPSANFFDVRPGDGESLNDLIIYQDNLFLFKSSSIWVFAYDTQPANAVLQQLHDGLGVDTQRCVALYENSLYFLKWNQVYQIANYDFTRISTKIPFEDDRTNPTNNVNDWTYPSWLSLVGDRLVIRYFNRIYVYHLRMRSWSRWDSQDLAVKYLGPIVRVEDAGIVASKVPYPVYVSGCSLNYAPVAISGKMYLQMLEMTDTYDATTTEISGVGLGSPAPTPVAVDILLSIKSKIYDVGFSHKFKRLMHWGVDVVTARDVTGTLFPYSMAYKVTWAQLHLYTWSQLQTWGYPLFIQPSTTQSVNVGTSVLRRYIRFPKGLRFRLLQFEVDMKTVGNTTDGPARLYTSTIFVAGKQLVPKAVN